MNTQSVPVDSLGRVRREALALTWDRVALYCVYAGIGLASIDVALVFDVATATVRPAHLLFGAGLVCAVLGLVRGPRTIALDGRTTGVLVAAGILMATQVLSLVAGFPGAVDAAGRIAVMIGGAAVPLLAIVLTINSRARFEAAVAVFVCAQLAFAIFGLYQLLSDRFGLPTPVDQIGIVAGAARISSFSLEPGYYAAYICTAIPLVAYMLITGRRLGPVPPAAVAVVLATVLLFANSRMGYLLATVTAAVAVLLLLRGRLAAAGVWRRLGAVLAGTLVLVPIVAVAADVRPLDVISSQFTNTVSAVSDPNADPNDCAGPDNNACTSNFVRSEVYRAGWEMFKDHPVLGVGDGRAIDELPAYGVDFFEGSGEATLQSVFLEVGAETGIVGIAALVFLLWRLARLVFSPARERDPGGEAWPARALLLGAFMMVLVGGVVLMWLWDVRVWSLVGLALAGLAVARAPAPAPR